MENIHLTELVNTKYAGKGVFYCVYSNHEFDSLEKIGDCEFCAQCYFGCDRKDYANAKKNNLRGLHMRPVNKDPIIYRVIWDHPINDNIRIKRNLYTGIEKELNEEILALKEENNNLNRKIGELLNKK